MLLKTSDISGNLFVLKAEGFTIFSWNLIEFSEKNISLENIQLRKVFSKISCILVVSFIVLVKQYFIQ